MNINTRLAVFNNDFQVFQCSPQGTFQPQITFTDLEVSEAYWVTPDRLVAATWRVPGQLPVLLELMDIAESP